MRFNKGLKKTSPSTPSEEVHEATQQWVKKVMEAYETRDPDVVSNVFEDSDEVRVMYEGEEPVIGKEAVETLYEWMFKTEDDTEWDLIVATSVGRQVMWTIEDADAEAKGKDPRATRLHLIAEKSALPGQEDKIRTFTVHGDNTTTFLDGFEARSGKRGNFNAGRRGRGGR